MALAPFAAAPAAAQTSARTEGKVVTETIRSTELGLSKSFKVYLPAGYPNGGPYPVLYLFRGTMDEWLNPQQDGSRQGRTAVTIYEALHRQGAVGDMILVFPGLGSDDGQAPGILNDWVSPAKAPGVGKGRFASFFFQELMPAVDAKFKTLASGDHQAVDGFSLGGWAALQAATSHPERFKSVGAFDGTFPYAKDRDHADPDDELWEEGFFDPVFGSPRDWAAVTATSPANRIAQSTTKRFREMTWAVEYCPQAIEPRGNFYRGAALMQILAGKGGKNSLPGELPDSSHSWWNADRHLEHSLPLHWAAIQPDRR